MLKEEVAEILYGELTYKNYLSLPDVRRTADIKIDQVINLFKAEVDKLTVIKGTQIGDNLDLEVGGEYPCSDGSMTMTVSVDKLLEVQCEADKDKLLEGLEG